MTCALRGAVLAVLATLGAVHAGCTGCAAPAPTRSSVAASASGRATPPRVPTEASPRAFAEAVVVGEYSAKWEPVSGAVTIEARFVAAVGTNFGIERDAADFVSAAEMSEDRDGARWASVARLGNSFEASACAAHACRIRYRVALRSAAKKIDDVDVASDEGEVVEAPPSAWLLTPTRAAKSVRVRFRVACPPGSTFVTGVFHSAEAADAWDISIDDLWTSPYSAFGPLRVRSISVSGGAVQLAIGPGKSVVTDDELAQWVATSASAVSGIYDHFPMPGALVLLLFAHGSWIGSGRTLSGGGGTVLVRLGEDVTSKAYRDDWVLIHEMIHLAFPSVAREHDWAEEGLATYLEPLARVRAGLLSEEDAWGGLVEGLPRGLPGPNDRGLDYTRTWGRTYWGGALFWLVADVEIRKRTANGKGLEDALRGIQRVGATNAVRWPLAEVLAAADRVTGVTVLSELHRRMGLAAESVDLRALFASLGVTVTRGRVRLEANAALAGIRRAIMSP